jgi:hypothetical protein
VFHSDCAAGHHLNVAAADSLGAQPFQVNQLFQGKGGELILGLYILLERLGEGGRWTGRPIPTRVLRS